MNIRTNRTKFVAEVVNYFTERIRDEINSVTKTCLNCLHFDEQTEFCKIAKCRPPARVIATSCKAHVDNDEIPF